MKMIRRQVVLGVVVGLVGMAAACSGDDDDETATTGEESSDLEWTHCPDDAPKGSCYEIAQVEVPINYDDAVDGSTKLLMTRDLADKPDKRIGALFINPGGPGASAVEFLAQQPLPQEVMDRFDIYGFDPRGVGGSEKLDCGIPGKELLGVDKVIDSADQSQHLIESAQELAAACESKYASLLPHVGTRDAARDMDHLRGLLGQEQISYVGFSYGTAIGQVYADMFPERVRAMVLDGVDKISAPGLDWNATQAASFEKALHSFADACAAWAECPLGSDPMAVINNVAATVQQAPIPAPSADRPLGPGEFNYGASMPLYSKDAWTDLADALAAANAGDGSKLVAQADEYLESGPPEAYYAVLCLDQAWPSGDTQAVLDAAKAAATTAPVFGEAGVNDSMFCAEWPTPPQPFTPVKAEGTPPIVVVSTTGDPATPYQAGVDLAAQLPQGVLVTHEGEGHIAYGHGNSCVDDAVDRYLTELKAPSEDLTCKSEPDT